MHAFDSLFRILITYSTVNIFRFNPIQIHVFLNLDHAELYFHDFNKLPMVCVLCSRLAGLLLAALSFTSCLRVAR